MPSRASSRTRQHPDEPSEGTSEVKNDESDPEEDETRTHLS